jgi:DMSO/TMAO reductase YedYZ heme-binding membrane subunit
MKTIQIISMSLTGILLFNTIVCGIWMRYSGAIITEANKNFHMVSGILAAVFVAVTLILTARW